MARLETLRKFTSFRGKSCRCENEEELSVKIKSEKKYDSPCKFNKILLHLHNLL